MQHLALVLGKQTIVQIILRSLIKKADVGGLLFCGNGQCLPNTAVFVAY